jgi:L-fuconolactonase
VESCPDLILVIDHMAKPPIACGKVDDWEREISRVAAYPNIHCKLSGLVTEANLTSWRLEDLRGPVECALQVFGPKRLMFGSDYPVCLLAASYERVLESFQELLKGLDEADRKCIFQENALKFYRLETLA